MDGQQLAEKSRVKVRQLVTDAGFNAQMRLFNSVGADATRERLMSDWTTQGVVGALVLSMTYQFAVENPLTEDGDPDPPWLATAFTYLIVITYTPFTPFLRTKLYFWNMGPVYSRHAMICSCAHTSECACICACACTCA